MVVQVSKIMDREQDIQEYLHHHGMVIVQAQIMVLLFFWQVVAVDLPTHLVDLVMVVVLEEVLQVKEETHQTLVDMVAVNLVAVSIDRLVVDIVPLVTNVQVRHFVEALPAEEAKVVVV